MTDRQHTAPSEGRGGTGIVAVLAFTGIVVSVMQSLVIPLLVKLPVLLHTSTANASWVITATLLAGAVAVPVTGRLGDMYGKRRLIFVSLALLIAGSLLCAATSAVVPMVVGRALQGAAMGVIPLGISVMRDVLPPQRMGSAVALMSASLGVGGALGFPASALIAQHFDWHVLFLGSAALGVVSAALIAALVPESPVRTPARFDIIGAAGLAAGLISLLLAVSKGSDWGWHSTTTIALFTAAPVILVAWGFFELRVNQPLVDLRTTARRQVLLTNLAALSIGFAMFAMSLILPQLLQLPAATGYGLGQSMVVAGFCVAPGGLVMMAVSPVSAWISRVRGPKTSLILGAAIIALGYAIALVLVQAVWQIILVICVIGAGIAVAYAAMPALIMAAVPLSETASANGFNSLMRSIGTSIAGAVIGVVLANSTRPFAGIPLPTMTGFRIGFAIACAASIAAMLITALIPGNRRLRPIPQTPQPIDIAEPAEQRS
jgi:MFS family permease